MNRRYPRYPDDADYQTNAPSYYEDLARLQKLFKILSERIWEYDKEIAEYFRRWEENLETINEDVIRMMIQWLEDGTIDHIINVELMSWKAEIFVSKNEPDFPTQMTYWFEHVEDNN